MGSILVVDDDKGMREFLEIMLTREGHRVKTVSGGKQALDICRKGAIDLVITDLKMPGIDGIALLRSIKDISAEIMVILITGYASGETALAAMKEGAYDYLEKNFDIEDLKVVVEDAMKKKGIHREDARFIKDMEEADSFGEMIGKSKEILKIYSLIRKVAETAANVLILGESGTGKELVARAIHQYSPRRDKPFIVINCGGIPENLLESELFGYMKGAFSGAYMDKPGLFEIAHRGTVFLDEIGDLSPILQVKILRVLQDKTFIRIGGSKNITVDVRFISATNQDLVNMVKDGSFREDLYYRLNVIPVKIPALRERKEDIPLLVKFFIEKYAREFGKDVKKISNYALDLLMNYPFPGNVRELENIIERSVALESGNIVLPESLVITGAEQSSADALSHGGFPEEGIDLSEETARFERALIQKALEKAKGSKTQAAKLLNVTFDSFRYRLEKLGISD
ncbi:MAG: sigma-54-dependent Fis family transcriptional regulator [Deltaproteobacteria bacterium]|nr:sigma-54-dependent Fis family transcriptional regulator [Deltaproteobacteria bacterium]